MTRNPDQRRHGDLAIREWQRRTNLALISCLVSTIIYLVEKLIIQIVTVAYRPRQFDHRIEVYNRYNRLLSKLYEKLPMEKFPQEKFKELYKIISSARFETPMDGIFGDRNFFGGVMREMVGHTDARNQGESYRIVSEALEEKGAAKELAEWIWESCISDKRGGLRKEDLLRVMGQGRVMGQRHENEVSECFSLLDRDGNGRVSLKEIKLHIEDLRKEKHRVENSWRNMVSKIYITNNPPAIPNWRA